MTRRSRLQKQLHSLGEIRDIMNSMKTLAFIESQKLSRFLDAQDAVVGNMEKAAADLLSAYPHLLPRTLGASTVYIVIGTERGFCADLNQALFTHCRSQVPLDSHLVVVGSKLSPLFENDSRVAAALPGANVVEEIPALLPRLVAKLSSVQASSAPAVYAVHHNREQQITNKPLVPPFQKLPKKEPNARAPMLNLAPGKLFEELGHHHLFALLHQLLYTSLMVENRYRYSHLQGAIKYLDERSSQLMQRCNMLRQEEIVQEIEVILLSAEATQGSVYNGGHQNFRASH